MGASAFDPEPPLSAPLFSRNEPPKTAMSFACSFSGTHRMTSTRLSAIKAARLAASAPPAAIRSSTIFHDRAGEQARFRPGGITALFCSMHPLRSGKRLWMMRLRRQPLPQLCPSALHRSAPDRDSDGLLLGHEHDQLLPPRHARVKQVPREHRVVLRCDRAARPVGAASATRTPVALTMRRMESSVLVLPIPGPPVITVTFALSTNPTAFCCDTDRTRPVFCSTHGRALSRSISDQGGFPEARVTRRSAMTRSAECRPLRKMQGWQPYRPTPRRRAAPPQWRHGSDRLRPPGGAERVG